MYVNDAICKKMNKMTIIVDIIKHYSEENIKK